MEQATRRILYHWYDEYHSFTYPEGRILREAGVEVFFAHNLETAEKLLRQGSYDLIAVHTGYPPGGIEFAREARKRYPQVLIIGLQEGAKYLRDIVIRGLGEDNPFDDVITRAAIGEQAITRNIRNLIQILEKIESHQKAAGVT